MARARPLTVLQALPALDAGGVERGTLEVAGALVRAGHRSIVVSAGGRLVDRLALGGSEHVTMPIGRKRPWTLALVRRLRRLLVDERVDVLHARSRLPAWIAWLAWRGMAPGARPRFVTTVHGHYSVSRYSEVMTRGEQVIAVSQAIRDYVVRSYPRCDASRVRVIPRGIDRAAFPYGYRPSEGWLARFFAEMPGLETRHILTLAGRLTRLKGHERFLDLLGTLSAGGLDVHGLVVGGGDSGYARALRRAARARAAPVTFLGHRDDVRDVYAVSDVVLSLSAQPESFGRTVLEALALGRPVVGFDHGGVSEILAEILPAGRVPPGDDAALAARVAGFLASPPEVPRSDAFALETMLAAELDLYAALAGGRERAA